MTRRANDAYFTPAWMTRALLDHVPEIDGQILEPCAGDLSIADVLSAEGGLSVFTNDIDGERLIESSLDASADNFAELVAEDWRTDWAITNPPYTMPTCTRIVEQAIRAARIGVAMMLRLSFLEPTDTRHPRGPFLASYPPQRMLVMPRYSFTQDGRSDSVTTAWMIWAKVPLSGPPMLSIYKADERYAEPWRRAA